MAEQLHKRFTDDQVRLLLDLYLKKAISLPQALEQLGCTKSRFYQILGAYKEAPEKFTVAYGRNRPNRRLPKEIDQAIREQLEIDRKLIGDKNTPLCQYNYSAVRDEVRRLGYEVSDQTVRNRGPGNGGSGYPEPGKRKLSPGKW